LCVKSITNCIGSLWRIEPGPEGAQLQPAIPCVPCALGGDAGGADYATGGSGIGGGVWEIQEADLSSLPENVQESFAEYDAAGWKGNVSGQTLGTKAGGIYKNLNGALSTMGADGNAITYREFDVNSAVLGQTRDAERFVVGSDGSIYYTGGHYGVGTFVKIRVS